MIETVQNQRVVTTKKEKCSGNSEAEYYTPINLIALKEAMNNLGGSAFKMWVYLGKNQNNYTFALSKVDAMAWCGFSKNTYKNAFDELVEAGYLVQTAAGSNHYDFYELSQKKEEEPVITVHKEEQPAAFTF